ATRPARSVRSWFQRQKGSSQQRPYEATFGRANTAAAGSHGGSPRRGAEVDRITCSLRGSRRAWRSVAVSHSSVICPGPTRSAPRGAGGEHVVQPGQVGCHRLAGGRGGDRGSRAPGNGGGR